MKETPHLDIRARKSTPVRDIDFRERLLDQQVFKQPFGVRDVVVFARSMLWDLGHVDVVDLGVRSSKDADGLLHGDPSIGFHNSLDQSKRLESVGSL